MSPLSKNAFITLTTSILLVGCGRGTTDTLSARRDANTGKVDIKRTYTVAVSEASNKALFTANFRESGIWGADIRLLAPSSLELNGKRVSEDAKIDHPDGGEIAAFYAGFLMPLFWIYLGDNGYVNYHRSLSAKTEIYTAVFVDPEAEKHIDQIHLPNPGFSIPNQASQQNGMVVTIGNDYSYDRISCGVRYKAKKTVTEKTQGSQGEWIEKSVTKRTNESKQFMARNGKVRFSISDLKDLDSDHFDIECEGNIERSLTGGSGGDLKASYKSRSVKVRLN